METVLWILAAGGGAALARRGRHHQKKAEEMEVQMHLLAQRLARLEEVARPWKAPAVQPDDRPTAAPHPARTAPHPPGAPSGPPAPSGHPDTEGRYRTLAGPAAETVACTALAQEHIAATPPAPELRTAPPDAPAPRVDAAEAPDADDDLVELPTTAPRVYTEKASPAEILFAGHYLNLVGLAILAAGALSLLRLTWSGGVLQCLAGFALGGCLVGAGDRFHRQGLGRYAHPMLATGFALLLLTLCMSHFYFGLVGREVLFLGMVALVATSGLAAVRYDSRLIADTLLGALFLGPLFATVRPEQTGALVAYLVALGIGTTWVALQRKWDFHLIAAFLGSYALYFHHVGLAHPGAALAFLAVTYALFLAANHLVHFLRRSSSDYNLVLSFVNPIAFAAVSYAVLLKLPNAFAVSTFLGAGLVHLALAALARGRAADDPSFRDLVTANLSVGLLFLAGATSFVPYFSTSTSWFSAATLLWFAQAFALQGAARALPDVAPLLRRGSYLAMLLVTAQLLVVVPTIVDESPHLFSERLLLNLACAALYFGWFLSARVARLDLPEERLARSLSALCGFLLLSWLALAPFDPVLGPPAAAALALAAGFLARRFPDDLERGKGLATLLAGAATLGAVAGPSAPAAATVALILLGARSLATPPSRLPEALALLAALRAVWIATGDHAAPALAGAALAVALAPLASAPGVAAMTSVLVAAVATLVPGFAPPDLLLQAVLAVAVGLALVRRLPEDPRVGATLGAGLALVLLGKAALLVGWTHPGEGLLAGAAATVLLMGASLRWPEALEEFRPLASLGALACGAVALALPAGPDTLLAGGLLALPGAALLRDDRDPADPTPALWLLCAAAGLGRLAWDAPVLPLAAQAVLALLLADLFRRHPERLRALEYAAVALASLVTLQALVGPTSAAAGALASAMLAVAARADRPTRPALGALALACLLRALALVAPGIAGTALWAAVGLVLLLRHPSLGRAALFTAFLKSVTLDGAFVAGPGGLEIASPGTLHPGDLLASAGLVAAFLASARLSREQVDVRNGFTLMALTAFAFRSAQGLYEVLGVLDTFQVLLSAFWGASAFLFITWGIHRELKVYRLFGLVILVATALKILVVDLWVLEAYSKTTTLLILGGLLMAVSFLYQSNRARLAAWPGLEPA